MKILPNRKFIGIMFMARNGRCPCKIVRSHPKYSQYWIEWYIPETGDLVGNQWQTEVYIKECFKNGTYTKIK